MCIVSRSAWSDASGIDVGGLMDSWTSKMGHPYIKVTEEAWDTSAGTVTLTFEQRWMLSDGSGNTEEAIWNIPLVEATNTKNLPGNVTFAKERQFTRTFEVSSTGW